MSEELRSKLAREAGQVIWQDLRAHAKRQGLFVVSAGLDLVDAALAIATDDATKVQAWLASGAIYRPTLAQLERWDEQLDKPFRSVVVQPFALAQELPSAPSHSLAN